MTQQLSLYQGPYTVELWHGAKTDHLPNNAFVSGNTIRVQHGSVQQVMGGIQFYAGNSPFSWGYKFIKRIVDNDGNELWHNWDDKG